MTEFCSISIVGFGVLAIALHLSALLKPRRSRHRPPNRYLPPVSRPYDDSKGNQLQHADSRQ